MPLSGVWLAFQVVKGASFLVYSLTGLHLKQKEKKKSELKYLRPVMSPSLSFVSRMLTAKTTLKSQDISTQNEQPKRKHDWDPLEPAYDHHGDLRSCKKISWQDVDYI